MKVAPAAQHVGANAPAPAKDACAVCDKKVYALEKVTVDDKCYHKGCMRCAHCNKVLSPGNYSANLGKLYCKPHLLQLFKLSGNYNSGFGSEPHKNKWIRQGAAGTDDSQHHAEGARPAPGAPGVAAVPAALGGPEPAGGEGRAGAYTTGAPQPSVAPSLRERLSRYEGNVQASNATTTTATTAKANGASRESLRSPIGQSAESVREWAARAGSSNSLVSARRASFEKAAAEGSSSQKNLHRRAPADDPEKTRPHAAGSAGASLRDEGAAAGRHQTAAADAPARVEDVGASESIRQPPPCDEPRSPFVGKEQNPNDTRSRQQVTNSAGGGGGKKKHVEIVDRNADDPYAHTYDERTVEVYQRSLELSPPLVRTSTSHSVASGRGGRAVGEQSEGSPSCADETGEDTRYDAFVRRADSQDMAHMAMALAGKGLVEEDELTYLRETVRRYKHEIATLREQVVQLNQTVEEQSRTIAQLRTAQPGDV